jgi:hypothetical protein
MTSFAFFTTLIARMGDASMAASQAFVMLLSLSFMQAVGISIAASTLVGRYVGAGKPARPSSHWAARCSRSARSSSSSTRLRSSPRARCAAPATPAGPFSW